MNDDINDKRLAAIAELAAALDELEHGDGLQRLTDGHGLQSRVFAFQWEEPSLQIDFRLPYERVLMDKEQIFLYIFPTMLIYDLCNLCF